MASVFKSPQFEWRQEFFQALDEQQPDVLGGLLAAARKNPSACWRGPKEDDVRAPLELALRRYSAWGVAWLLEQGEALRATHLEYVFKEIKNSQWAADKIAVQLVERLWPILLPHVQACEGLRKTVVKAYFEGLVNGRLAPGVRWDTLSMGAVVGDLVNVPFLTHFGMALTPFQWAFLADCPYTAHALLRAGAEPLHPVRGSGMPGWTLEKALEQVQVSQTPGATWSNEEIQACVQNDWGVTSSQVIKEVPQLFFTVSTFTDEVSWEHIQGELRARRRALALEDALPVSLPTKNGPRF